MDVSGVDVKVEATADLTPAVKAGSDIATNTHKGVAKLAYALCGPWMEGRVRKAELIAAQTSKDCADIKNGLVTYTGENVIPFEPQATVASSFEALHKLNHASDAKRLHAAIHEAMKPQGFSWAAGWTHTEDLSGKPHVLVRDLDKDTYQIWLKRYQELPSTDGSGGGGGGSGGGFDIPFDINPYLTEMHPEAINAAYMNTHFQKFLKVLGSGSAEEKKLLDELHKSFAALSQDEQKFAKMFLADVQNGDAKLEPGLAFYDYVQKYIKQAKDDLIHAHAEGMGIDEQKLRDLADAHPNAANLNLNKRFDLLMETVDKAKAKAYIEKIRGGITIKPKDVMIEADEILRDFLIV